MVVEVCITAVGKAITDAIPADSLLSQSGVKTTIAGMATPGKAHMSHWTLPSYGQLTTVHNSLLEATLNFVPIPPVVTRVVISEIAWLPWEGQVCDCQTELQTKHEKTKGNIIQ